VLNDAVYERNAFIEDTFNVKLESYNPPKTFSSDLTATIAAGADDYDAAVPRILTAGPMMLNGSFIDLKSLDSISLDMPWWDQNAVSQLETNDKLFIVTGDLFYSHWQVVSFFMYNKRIASDYKLGSLYDYVYDDKWISDTFIELCRKTTVDLDGNGQGPGDLYGVSVQNSTSYTLINGSGISLIERDNSGKLVWTSQTERLVQVLDKYINMYNNYAFCTTKDLPTAQSKGVFTAAYQDFPAGKSFFQWGTARRIAMSFRDMEDDFGILPMPKFDESQESYHHDVNSYTGFGWTIPVIAPDAEYTAYIMDALAYYGSDTIIPAFYEQCFEQKYARDEESIEMMKLIYSTTMYDFMMMYNLAGVRGLIWNMFPDGENTYMSMYEANRSKLELEIEKYNSVE
nr:hypothetical protein [Clostridia bacterium]